MPRYSKNSGSRYSEDFPPDVAKIRVGRTAALREGQFFKVGFLAHRGGRRRQGRSEGKRHVKLACLHQHHRRWNGGVAFSCCVGSNINVREGRYGSDRYRICDFSSVFCYLFSWRVVGVDKVLLQCTTSQREKPIASTSGWYAWSERWSAACAGPSTAGDRPLPNWASPDSIRCSVP